MWSIDFCEDNLQRISGAAEAAEKLQQEVKCLVEAIEGETAPVRFYRQRCIGACMPCHRQSLILRLNDEIITGEDHSEVIASVLVKISSSIGKNMFYG